MGISAEIVAGVNAALARAVDGVLAPFAGQSPLVGLAVVSVVLSVALVAAMRATVDERRLAAVRRGLRACVFEIRLFNDRPAAMWRAVGEMLRHTLVYFRLLTAPVLITAVPMGLLFAQLQSHYGYTGLNVGDQALVKVRLNGDALADDAGSPSLIVPSGLRVDSPVVRIGALHEAAWRIVALRQGEFQVGVRIGDDVVTKSVRVSSDIARRSPIRASAALANQLLNPAERPLPSSARVVSIAVAYPDRTVAILGFEMPWPIVLIAMSMAMTALLRRLLRGPLGP